MRICAFSDTHGQYHFDVEECDLVLIAGDVVPIFMQSNTIMSELWFNDFFIPWCTNLPCKKVVFVGGNHDEFFEKHPDRVRKLLEGQDKITYLCNEFFEYEGVRIFGTPLCKPFGRWSFMVRPEKAIKVFETQMPFGDVDILLTHDAPYGFSDVLLQDDCPWLGRGHIGNKAITWLIDTMKPKYHIHGHLHSADHGCNRHNDTNSYTVSLLDENYTMAYGPLYLDI